MITFEEFKKIDLLTARIIEAREHPGADRLYVLIVDTGEEKKQIVAGIRNAYTLDELVGKMVVVANNLEPVTIRGEESFGMLLAAGSEGGPVLLVPEKEVSCGTKIK